MTTTRRRAIEVLLVEDNAGTARLTSEALQDGGLTINVTLARDGVEAMEHLSMAGGRTTQRDPDLIVLDLNLPRKNGFEVLDEVKRDPKFKHIPVVVLTSSSADCDIERVYELHGNCFITKPDDLDTLIEAMRTLKKFWLGASHLPSEAQDHA